MPAPIHDFYAECGSKFIAEILWQNAQEVAVSLASYTKGRMQIRRSLETTDLVPVVSIDDINLWVDGITGDGGIFLNYNGITGNIGVEIEASTTELLSRGKYFYDLELVDTNDEPFKLIKGRFIVEGEATRP